MSQDHHPAQARAAQRQTSPGAGFPAPAQTGPGTRLPAARREDRRGEVKAVAVSGGVSLATGQGQRPGGQGHGVHQRAPRETPPP